jgi:hypothetical protein
MRFLSAVVAAFGLGTSLFAVQPASASPIAAAGLTGTQSNLVRVDDGICGDQCQAERWRRHRYGYRQDDGICGEQCQAELRWRHRQAYRQDNGVCEQDCQAELRWRRRHGGDSYGSWDGPRWQHRPRGHYRVYQDD